MTKMIYVDPDFGPSAQEIFEAVRIGDGWPGQFLTALGAEPLDARQVPSVSSVHESHAPYVVSHPSAPKDQVRRRRLASVLARAEHRAESLAAGGRHGAAVRLLERAIRVLQGREEGEHAAKCAISLAWILRSRGNGQAACGQAERVQTLTSDPGLHAAASATIGVLWTDAGRYAEAEAALRAAAAAAVSVRRFDVRSRADLGLARTLLWREQTGDALAVLADLYHSAFPDVSCEAHALSARIRVAAGDAGGALQPASVALDAARALHVPRLLASAHRAMAMALRLAGDRTGAAEHAEAGLQVAIAAHLPLTALKLRCLRLTCLTPDSQPAAALRNSLQKSALGRVPQTVRSQIEAASRQCEALPRTRPADNPGARVGRVLAELVEAAQRAADDHAALIRVLDVVCDRIHAASAIVIAGSHGSRLLATTGRPWRERSASARRALESGLAVPVDGTTQPPEVAEPVKYARRTGRGDCLSLDGRMFARPGRRRAVHQCRRSCDLHSDADAAGRSPAAGRGTGRPPR